MSEKLLIHDREPGHNDHPGQHSIRRSLDIAIAKFNAYRQERTLSNEAGHTPDRLPFAGQPKTVKDIFVEYGQTDTELDIYIHPDWQEHANWENEGGRPVPLRDQPAVTGIKEPNTHSDSRPALK